MSEAFLGEVRIFAGNFPPTGWAFCNGQLLPISQNTALFSILGTTYGGDGKSNFALPNLVQRMPLHAGNGPGPGLSDRVLGEMDGSSTVTLLQNEMPMHGHTQQASTAVATTIGANNGVLAKPISPNPPYHDPVNLQALGPAALGASGGNAPHNNQQPYLQLNFIIAMQGIFPPRG